MTIMLRLLSEVKDGQIGDNAKVAESDQRQSDVTMLRLLSQIRDGEFHDSAELADSWSDW